MIHLGLIIKPSFRSKLLDSDGKILYLLDKFTEFSKTCYNTRKH